MFISPAASDKNQIWKAVLLHDLFSQSSTMSTCYAHQIFLGGPAKWAANVPAFTGSAQIGLLFGTLSFSPPNHSSLVTWQIWQYHHFFLMSSQTSTGDSVSSFHTSYNKTNPKERKEKLRPTWKNPSSSQTKDMMQGCFKNSFFSTVHSIMVHRNPITTNCSSQHEHLARNDFMSFLLSNFFYNFISSSTT